jgi:viroplasmin and RNaseH domain-containing protein
LGSEPFVYGTPVKDAGPDPHHKGKWYAIRRGYKIGVVSSWERCKPLVIGFHGAEYRSFNDLNEARSWVLEGKREAMASRKQCRVQFSSFV